jgi:predicted nucleic acid-binding protein
MIIGLIEGDFIQQQLIKTNLMHHTIFSSELARLETRLLAIRMHNQKSLEQFDKFFMVCKIISLDRAVFERATYLRANNHLKTPDALHLAAAIQANCDEFWTNDKQLINTAHQYLKVVDLTMLN